MIGDAPRRPASATRLLLVGYYEAGLAGDEAILRVLVRDLMKRFPGVSVTGYVEAAAGQNLEAAANALSEAITASFCPAWAHFNRAQVRLQLGDKAGARADLEAALAIDPGLAIAREHLESLAGAGTRPDETAD